MIKISIDIKPRPAPRPRVGSRGTYHEQWYVDYRNDIRQQAEPFLWDKCYEGDLKLTLTFFKNANTRSKQYGDADNLAKGVMDALIGLAYFDDAQVTELNVKRYKSEYESIDIYIEFL